MRQAEVAITGSSPGDSAEEDPFAHATPLSKAPECPVETLLDGNVNHPPRRGGQEPSDEDTRRGAIKVSLAAAVSSLFGVLYFEFGYALFLVAASTSLAPVVYWVAENRSRWPGSH